MAKVNEALRQRRWFDVSLELHSTLFVPSMSALASGALCRFGFSVICPFPFNICTFIHMAAVATDQN